MSDFEGFDPAEIDDSSDEEECENLGQDPDFRECYRHQWLPEFDKQAGPKGFTADSSPYQIFSSIFTDEVLDLLVTETNRYVVYVPQALPSPQAHHYQLACFSFIQNHNAD